MPDNPIHFGTSGWRGVIAEDFTFSNVRLAAAGIANFLLTKSARPHVVVGYDTRFLSEKFADAVAETLGTHGIDSWVCQRPDPTPAISFHVIANKLAGGVNITASHNPAEYNGLKFSSSDGAPALPEVTREIEKFVGLILAGELSAKGPMFAAPLRHPADPRPAYLDDLRRKVDLKVIGSSRMNPSSRPSLCAVRNNCTIAGERSIGGRFSPPVTSTAQRWSNGRRARNLRSSTGASFSRITRMSTSACASAAITFDRVPPETTPGFTVIPRFRLVNAEMQVIWRASSTTALAPA